MANNTGLLIYKDLILELRSKSAVGGILVYIVSTIFVCYLAFSGFISISVWNALFWIILLFTSFNTILKGFMSDNSEVNFYYYELVSPQSFINSKIIYNTLLMTVMSFITLAAFIVFMGNIIQNIFSFIVVMLIGVIGISSVLTLMSAIASKAKNNFTLMAILSFPLILPQLIVLLNATSKAIDGVSIVVVFPDIVVSVLISLIAIVLSNVLFPYVWQE